MGTVVLIMSRVFVLSVSIPKRRLGGKLENAHPINVAVLCRAEYVAVVLQVLVTFFFPTPLFLFYPRFCFCTRAPAILHHLAVGQQ